MKKILALALFLVSFQLTLSAQLNDYKYIVVPVKFATFKNPNQFQTSTLIKHYMTQEGFNVIYDNALPLDLQENRCLALFTDLLDESTLFKTKVALVLRDCKGETIFKTIEANTKTKDLNMAYKEVVTEACTSFQGLEHNYNPVPSTNKETITVSFKDDVKKIEDSVEKMVGAEENVSVSPSIEASSDNVVKEIKSIVEEPSDKSEEKEKSFYAEPIENGYKLMDQDGSIKYILAETSIENVFLVNQDGINGVILKKDEKWFLEYNDSTGKVVKELHINF